MERLQANLESLRAHLRQPECAELGQRLSYLRDAYSTSPACAKREQATYFEFTVEALCLLIILDETLKVLQEKDIVSQSSTTETSTKSKNPTHSPPKAILGVSDLKLVQSLLQFIVSLGIYPHLLPGVDTLLKLRLSHAKSVAKSQHTLNAEKSWPKNATNIIFPNGSIDPWHALGITSNISDSLTAVFITGTAHCANMYPPRDSDLPGLVSAREEISQIIGQWLSQ